MWVLVSQLYLLARVGAVTVGGISVLWRLCETPLTGTPPLYYSCHRLLSSHPPQNPSLLFSFISPSLSQPLFKSPPSFFRLFPYPSSPIISLHIALCPHKSPTALPSVQAPSLHIPPTHTTFGTVMMHSATAFIFCVIPECGSVCTWISGMQVLGKKNKASALKEKKILCPSAARTPI